MEVAILQTLKIRGRSTPESIADVVDPEGPPASEAIDRLVDSGHIAKRDGSLFLGDLGSELLEIRLADERSSIDRPALMDLYAKFQGLNDTFKKLATDWQLRKMGSQSVPNDHTDFSYDDRVIRRLGRFHGRTVSLMVEVKLHVPRMESYARRLSRARDRLVDEGDHRFFTSLEVDSYHTAWFELHQDLITCLDMTRDDGASEESTDR